MLNHIRVKTVGSNGRNLAVAKGDLICVSVATFNLIDDYWLVFWNGAVIVKTTAARYARRVYSGETLADGLLVTHTTSGVRVWIPLNKAERPVLELYDKNGRVKFLPDTYRIARRQLMALFGRFALYGVLATLLLLAGCAAEVNATCSETTPHNSTLLGAVYAPAKAEETIGSTTERLPNPGNDFLGIFEHCRSRVPNLIKEPALYSRTTRSALPVSLA